MCTISRLAIIYATIEIWNLSDICEGRCSWKGVLKMVHFKEYITWIARGNQKWTSKLFNKFPQGYSFTKLIRWTNNVWKLTAAGH